MTVYQWVAVSALLLIIAVQVLNSLQLAMLRRSGRYPQRGKATMDDVERLLSTGSRTLAVRCYREIHLCSLRQASEAVAALSTERR
jgi:hypothetical protein